MENAALAKTLSFGIKAPTTGLISLATLPGGQS